MIAAKRLLDLGLATLGAVVTAPLVGALALAIKLDSPGPALFVQTRVGRGGKLIRIAKLRTMRSDNAGPAVTADRDPRITRIGARLRKAKLDELPQLWSVIRGDMSLVGPRPEVPSYVAHYRDEWKGLLDVAPGVTDEASLAFRDEERLLAAAHDRERAYLEVIMPMKLSVALEGLVQSSIAYDLGVLARTALAVLPIRRRAEHPAVAEARRRIAALDIASCA